MIFLYLINIIQAHRILIVGCGIGGSSLAEMLNPHFQVVVYDKAKECGGRVDDLEFDTFRVEFGATMFIEENKYFKNYLERYNLTKKDRENHGLGIFNKEMVFQTSDSDVITLAKMIYRYGLSPKTLKDDIKMKLQKFLRIYDYQAKGKFFTNYDQFLQIIGLDKIPQKFQDYLEELNLNQQFRDEFVKAVIAGIYNQDSDVNSVAGIVSLIAAFSESFRVAEGNREIIRNNMKSVTRYHSKVVNITKNEYGRYLVNGQDEYQVVVIANLISYSNISFNGLDNQIDFEEQDGQDAYIYILAAEGVIKSAFVNEDEELPKSIIITDNDSALKEIGFVCENCFEGKNVYKLQAQAKIEVEKYFYNFKILYGKHWKPAYPRLIPGKQAKIELDKVLFILLKNLYYLNSMEYVASCMEMEIISARNIANKILHDYYTLSPQPHDDL